MTHDRVGFRATVTVRAKARVRVGVRARVLVRVNGLRKRGTVKDRDKGQGLG